MNDQATQLDILADVAGYDTGDSIDVVTFDGIVDNRNPLALLLMKEKVEQDVMNPCIGCIYEHTQSDAVLDYCHYNCKETVEIIDMV